MTSAADLAPLRSRLGVLFVLRLALAGTILAIALVPGALLVPGKRIMTLVAVYLFVAVSAEVLRQWRRTLPVWTVGAGVLLDGLFIAAAVTFAGGVANPFSFLLPVHLVAVTLLASYRTGLKVAIWQSLLLVTAQYLPPNVTGVEPPSARWAAVQIGTFLAVAITTALCSAVNEGQLRRNRQGFQTLAEMAATLETVHDPDGVVDVLLHALPRGFPTRRAAVMMREPARIVRWEAAGPTTVAPVSQQPDLVVAQCWAERAPILRRVLDPVTNPVLAACLPGATNVIVIPLTADREPVGALVVEHGGPSTVRIQASAVALLAQFAAHTALALRNARLLVEVQHLAAVDPLTGLANRRTFEATLHREIARSVRTAEDVSLLLIDVDHFKRVNDTLGHPVGDEVLRHVGRVLSTYGREVDLPARYGGEEFAVILPACPAQEAVHVAERLRAGIAGPDSPVTITASVGVAGLPRNATTADALIAAADAALYQAKQAGRDRTVAAGSRLQAVGATV